MTADATQEQILDAAERHFGSRGFAATSLRRVIADAGVNQAAIHYHFGSKEAVFDAVLMRRLEPLDEERRRVLADLQTVNKERALFPEDIIEAFLAPSFRLLDNCELGEAWLRIVARYNSEPGPHWARAEKTHSRTLRLFIQALRVALPGIPTNELDFRVLMFLELAAAILCGARRSKLFTDGLPTIQNDSEGVMQRLVAFIGAGLRAPLSTPTGRSRKPSAKRRRRMQTG